MAIYYVTYELYKTPFNFCAAYYALYVLAARHGPSLLQRSIRD